MKAAKVAKVGGALTRFGLFGRRTRIWNWVKSGRGKKKFLLPLKPIAFVGLKQQREGL